MIAMSLCYGTNNTAYVLRHSESSVVGLTCYFLQNHTRKY